jgi:putative oxidoreductase
MNTNTSAQAVAQTNIAPARSATPMERVERIATIIGRALVALLFILAGAAKILNPAPFLHHMAEVGVPTFLLPAVIALELGGGLAILIGWRAREAAAALGVFCVLTAAIFHHQLSISAERTLFFKDLAIAGGLLVLAASAAASARMRSGGRLA